MTPADRRKYVAQVLAVNSGTLRSVLGSHSSALTPEQTSDLHAALSTMSRVGIELFSTTTNQDDNT
jgi:hypothetical protein